MRHSKGDHGPQPASDNDVMSSTTVTTGYGERLQLAITEAHVTVRELAEHLGITSQAIYKVLRGSTKTLQASHHIKACKFLRVEPQWLSDGVGGRHLRGPVALTNNPDYPSVRRVNFAFDAGVTGFRVDHLDENEAEPIVFRADWFKARGYVASRLVATRVSGDSMEPTLFDGDTVVINLDAREPRDGDVYAARYEDQLVVKRVFREGGHWWLHSDNPDQRRFPRRQCGPTCEIIGRVVHRQSEHL